MSCCFGQKCAGCQEWCLHVQLELCDDDKYYCSECRKEKEDQSVNKEYEG